MAGARLRESNPANELLIQHLMWFTPRFLWRSGRFYTRDGPHAFAFDIIAAAPCRAVCL